MYIITRIIQVCDKTFVGLCGLETVQSYNNILYDFCEIQNKKDFVDIFSKAIIKMAEPFRNTSPITEIIFDSQSPNHNINFKTLNEKFQQWLESYNNTVTINYMGYYLYFIPQNLTDYIRFQTVKSFYNGLEKEILKKLGVQLYE